MVQFRKSKKFGPVRITASKKGIGVSAGAGPVRISRGADGKVRRTVRVPGAGIYDTKVIGGTGKQPAQPQQSPRPSEGMTGYTARTAPTFRCGIVHLPQPVSAKGYTGTVTFDGTTVWVTRKGLAAKLGGLQDVTFPITSVSHIDWQEPTMMKNGHLRFEIPDNSGFVPPAPLPAQDSYTVLVTKQQRKHFEVVLGALNASANAPSRR